MLRSSWDAPRILHSKEYRGRIWLTHSLTVASQWTSLCFLLDPRQVWDQFMNLGYMEKLDALGRKPETPYWKWVMRPPPVELS